MELRKLKATRAGNRGAVSRKLNKHEGSEECSKEVLLLVYEDLMKKRSLMNNLDEQILSQTAEEEIENEIIETDEYNSELDIKLMHFKKFIDNNFAHVTGEKDSYKSNDEGAVSNPLEINQIPSDHTTVPSYAVPPVHEHFPVSIQSGSLSTASNHKLPKLSLPTFNGNKLEWQSFWDSFSSGIDENVSLSNVQKFNYLKSLLLGEALLVVEGFTLTNANYAKAIELLKERYGQPHKITRVYMQALLDLTEPSDSLHSLREFYDKMETYVRGLETLNQTEDSYGSFLVPVILRKLPSKTKQNLARSHGSDDWTLGELRKSLRHELSILEAGSNTDADWYSGDSTFQRTANFHTKAFKGKPINNRKQPKATPETGEVSKYQSKSCVFCDDKNHMGGNCTLTTERKKMIVKQKSLCFNCLGSHRVKDCPSKTNCKKCGKRHHTYLCAGSKETTHESTYHVTSENIQSSTKYENVIPTSTSLHTSSMTNIPTILKTATAKVTNGETVMDTTVLFDEGSQRSFITEELAQNLNLKQTGTETLMIAAFGGKEIMRTLKTSTLFLIADSGERIQIHVVIVPCIAAKIHTHQVPIKNLTYLKRLKLAHSYDGSTFDVSLLIGVDHFWDIVGNDIIRGSGPTAVSSKIGYLLSGPTHSSVKHNHVASYNILSYHRPEELNLEKFWKIEDMGSLEKSTDMPIKDQNYVTFENGHYTAKLPWKEEVRDLPSNDTIALERTKNVIRRLSRDPDMLKTYNNIIEEQEKCGFIEKIEQEDTPNQQVHYIPHHPVKKDSSTTPIRIVYDCSCKQSGYLSLNDCLESHSPQLNEIPTILTRFRAKRYAVSTDIEKAFLQIRLHEKDRDMTRFFWLTDYTNPDAGISTYRFKVVLFGATCSPFLLNKTLETHFERNPCETQRELSKSLYVDNVLTSFNDENSLMKFYKTSRVLLAEAGFNLRSWNSNSTKLCDAAAEDRVLDSDNIVKILGLRWNPKTDQISFPKLDLDINRKFATKREVLSQSSKIFDPLGILSPITVRAKLLMQDLWQENVAWDKKLPRNYQEKWYELTEELAELSSTTIPRYLREHSASECTVPNLHIFTDASKSAYGACAYLVTESTSHLIMAKNRVAPIKPTTLPRLELMGAVIGARLANYLNGILNVKSTTLWCDSQIVLHWLQSKKPMNQFITNRKAVIEESTKGHTWKYIPSNSNPADLQTRGISYKQFKDNSLWMNGPPWLTEPSQYPKWEISRTSALTMSTDKENTEDGSKNIIIPGVSNIIDISRFSSLQKLLRVTCYVLRFVKVFKSSSERNNQRRKRSVLFVKQPQLDEMNESTVLWIKDVQQKEFQKEITAMNGGKQQTSLQKQLKLYPDDKGLLRCKGRIDNSSLEDSAKYPVLLPKKHQLTDLIIMDIHKRSLHSGCSQTITEIRQSFWIPAIRHSVNHVLKKCIPCQKVIGQPFPLPDPPPLPKDRVSDCIPFSIAGVDYAGPLHVKVNRQTKKMYICLFTCATTRAVHLELVQDLSTETFVLAFKRFITNKGMPHTIYSDNGSTFLPAQRCVMEETGLNINWKFIPKGAPWHGGFWERLIRITKTTLRKILGKALVNETVLRTILCETEAAINDRPLTYVSSDIKDPQPLTPSLLLNGRRALPKYFCGPEKDLHDEETNQEQLTKTFIRKQKLLFDLSQRWKREYLTSLREHHRCIGNNVQTLKVGDVVQIYDTCPRVNWRLGMITELLEGRDHYSRSAILKTSNGHTTSRPVSKLYPLEL
ncbi:uncharacterized protein LOC134277925 [Saccostrea cucullata]|uniref:uncharacterized protein LOC134277925 n=1 Tax=Saccostrea cuccullata TaxID=36930 RepID=UPI002ED3E65A